VLTDRKYAVLCTGSKRTRHPRMGAAQQPCTIRFSAMVLKMQPRSKPSAAMEVDGWRGSLVRAESENGKRYGGLRWSPP
jgi:hypothetical protein